MKQYQTLLFYKYVKLADAEEYATRLLRFCKKIGIKCRILVGDEGINGSASGTPELCKEFTDYVTADERLSDVWFKLEWVDEPSFVKTHVRYRKEIVTLGDRTAHLDPNQTTGGYLLPEQFLEMKDQDDVVILDTRNVIEYETGHFKNAIHLNIETFRDLPSKVDALEPYKDKKILAYCTGGIRCEKATAFLMEQGFPEVYQLHGGILNYYQKTGGKDFDGKMYVFDNRIVTDVNDVNPTIISTCYICGTTTPRIVNCANPECNLHAPMCENCGEEYQGACSSECKEHPRKRDYNPKGYYVKPGHDAQPKCGCIG